ncbi:hypothetical protein ACETRX_35150 [Labrys portucalensis]|uniref:Uncharacterized protein n=1 Tax=Labrys neptuniae TaxID=376174 RepID=A0ABV6ZRR2_9HYPH
MNVIEPDDDLAERVGVAAETRLPVQKGDCAAIDGHARKLRARDCN